MLWRPLLANCRTLILRTGKPASNTAPPVADSYAWQRTCAAARDMPAVPSAEQVRAFLELWLQPWSVRGPAGEPATGLATSYYEPLVHASRERGGAYQWPLYAVPPDLLTIDLGGLYPELVGKRVRGKLDGRRVVPYDTRAEIERPERQPPAIVWVDDPVEAFFLQVQGTGRAVLDIGPGQGSTIRLAYADHNGHPYVSIGKWLIDKGELTMAQASMQGIRAWAQRNPARVKEMLNANPAVVFFREEAVADASEGPKGALGLPLTPLRSIAVDPSIVPLGSLAYLATTRPNTRQPMNLAVLAQDTGTAIKGPARVDLFWGFGDEAGDMAGRMKQESRLWVLWPKGEGVPIGSPPMR
ncbi:Membrane-bound lytic murein transglycosylase A precursor [Pigmentiphaga humi]|uniref:peptidoglycan lytic exotransglycosylase n=1 Tax=Pigmentiphaga humi TaxID=2478468 RepID=A0A3P4B3W0_9BURK|nr:Membrane-bound lytic murein transglycosylase A precursor [Pigmentiphaga humi]